MAKYSKNFLEFKNLYLIIHVLLERLLIYILQELLSLAFPVSDMIKINGIQSIDNYNSQTRAIFKDILTNND